MSLKDIEYFKCIRCGHPVVEIQNQVFHVELEDVTGTDEDTLLVNIACGYFLNSEEIDEYMAARQKELEQDVLSRLPAGYGIRFFVGDAYCTCKKPEIDRQQPENYLL